MSEEEKQIFNKMIYCNLINGEQALKFNRKYKDLQQKVEQLGKENKRLNNIINELEKHLNQEIIEWQDDTDDWIKAQVQEDRVILIKLKELKRRNK